MNVALDATPLSEGVGGLGRYTVELATALRSTFPDDRFVLVSDQRYVPPPAVESIAGPVHGLNRRWWSFGLPRLLRQRRVTVFHGTDFAVPYLPVVPSVMTVHDLSPWKNPTWHDGAGRVRHRAPALIGFGLATMIVTPSEAVRREVIHHFRIAPARVIATPLAAASHLRATGAEPSNYFVYVGALEPRKNLAMLVDAWREVRRSYAVDLVLAGRRRAGFTEIVNSPGLILKGEVPESDLPDLYSRALAFVYPSFYEGFGLPVLEAMQCGAAVITSKDPAITEVAGGAAIQVDAGDTRGWIDALSAAVRTPERLVEWRIRSRRRAADFSWEKTARLTRRVYDEAIRRFA